MYNTCTLVKIKIYIDRLFPCPKFCLRQVYIHIRMVKSLPLSGAAKSRRLRWQCRVHSNSAIKQNKKIAIESNKAIQMKENEDFLHLKFFLFCCITAFFKMPPKFLNSKILIVLFTKLIISTVLWCFGSAIVKWHFENMTLSLAQPHCPFC